MMADLMTSAVAATFFANPYLIENVLYLLPMQDLLRCMRVSSDWKRLIDSSARLQRNLFMRPSALPPIPLFVHDTENEDISEQYTSACYASPVHPPETLDDTKPKFGYLTNPLLIDQDYTTCPRLRVKHDKPKTFRELTLTGGDERFLAMLREAPSQPSWTKMYITQPPTNLIKFLFVRANRERRFANKEVVLVNYEGPLTWGHIAKWTNNMMRAPSGMTDLFKAEEREEDFDDEGVRMWCEFTLIPQDKDIFFLYDRGHPGEGETCGKCERRISSIYANVV
ncbi:hypothetical protein BDZ85DRAFT_88469 [Elsinoe ampelina]|uniref:F-box domain-containing protein n=1 Tax=Elsinoe ampelina TaxID=302913 RepID=A0A6A6GHE6_9PEZI|nr:hypothetical protein BDZ85DRAFT_88469 [Elsinoe ampelina]